MKTSKVEPITSLRAIYVNLDGDILVWPTVKSQVRHWMRTYLPYYVAYARYVMRNRRLPAL